MEAPGDHQVEHQPDVIFQADGDALSDAAHLLHHLVFGGGQRRCHGAQEERSADERALEGVRDDAGFQCFHVDRDVRQFGHVFFYCCPKLAGGFGRIQLSAVPHSVSSRREYSPLAYNWKRKLLESILRCGWESM